MRARARLRRLLDEGRYDVVICHQPWCQGLFGGVAARHGVGFVAYFHGPFDIGWPERMARRTRPLLVVGPSRHTVDQARRLIPGVRSEVLNYPLPAQMTEAASMSQAERTELRASLGAAPDDVVVLQASRIERWKGPDLTLKALVRLKDVPGWKFWLAGGPQREHEHALASELREIAAAGGISDRVSFLGQRSDVPRLMRAADVYSQGNRGAEGFSLSFLEASYTGLPIVTTDLGGAGEMIDPETGVLVPPGEDVGELAEGLRGVLTDAARRARKGERARAKAVRLCDTKQQFHKLAGWFGEVSGAKPSQAAEVTCSP